MKKLSPLDTADIATIVDEAKAKAQVFKDDRLKTNQIRNFYSSIEQMRIKFQQEKNKGNNAYEAIKTDLLMLKPKLAYAAGKQFAVKKNFYPFMVEAIDAVEASDDKDKAIENYFALIESVVGYHKYYGDS